MSRVLTVIPAKKIVIRFIEPEFVPEFDDIAEIAIECFEKIFQSLLITLQDGM